LGYSIYPQTSKSIVFAADNVEELCVQRLWMDVTQGRRSTNFRDKSKRLKQATNVHIHKTGFSFYHCWL